MDIPIWQVWGAAGIVLLICELFTPGFIVAVFGLACFASAGAAALHFSFVNQLLAFGIATGILFFTVRPLVLSSIHKKTEGVATNVDSLIGKLGQVIERIDPATGSGRVKLSGEEWKAAALGNTVLEPGARILVKKIEGCTVFVEPQ